MAANAARAISNEMVMSDDRVFEIESVLIPRAKRTVTQDVADRVQTLRHENVS